MSWIPSPIFEHVDGSGAECTVVVVGGEDVGFTVRGGCMNGREAASVVVPRQALVDALADQPKPPVEVIPQSAPVTVHITHGDVTLDDAQIDRLVDQIVGRIDAQAHAGAERQIIDLTAELIKSRDERDAVSTSLQTVAHQLDQWKAEAAELKRGLDRSAARVIQLRVERDELRAKIADFLTDIEDEDEPEPEVDEWAPGTDITGRLHEHPRVWLKDGSGTIFKPLGADRWRMRLDDRWGHPNGRTADDIAGRWTPIVVASQADLDAAGIPEGDR